jgi:hypothetical protein
VFLLSIFPIATAVLVEIVDLKEAWKGHISDSDSPYLWLLVACFASSIVAFALSALANDAATVERDEEIARLKREAGALTSERDRERAAHSKLEQDFLSLQETCELFFSINKQFLFVVSRKRERLKLALNKAQIEGALDPQLQGQHLIMACWQIFSDLLKKVGGPTARLRIAYFRVVGRRLEPRYCWNGTAADCVSLGRGDMSVARAFMLDSKNETSAAQAAANTGETHWIPTTSTMGKPFTFFEHSEKQTLRSMVAAPVRIDGDVSPFDVVTLDTNLEGFFDSGRLSPLFEHVLENLAYRLHMEKEVERLIAL